MRDLLVEMPHTVGGVDKAGSWDKDQGFIGSAFGTRGTEAMAIVTQEV